MDEAASPAYSITRIVVMALLAAAVVPRPLRSQTAADSSAVLGAMLEYLLAPEHASHYYGERPWKPVHPRGEPHAFCLAWGHRVASGPRRLESPAIVGAVRDRVTAVFGLRYVEGCVLRHDQEGQPLGFFDGRGFLAVQVQVGVTLRSSSQAYAHFGINPGAWPGIHGWRCLLERSEDDAWHVVASRCSYYES